MRAVLQRLVLLGVSLIIGTLLAEAMVRLVHPQQLILKRPDVWKPVDSLGWVHHANLHTTINTGEGAVRLITDEEGFRVGLEGRVDAETRVLILGDSFIEALQVEYEESIPGLLQARLPAALGRPVAIRSAAVGGWDPRQYRLQAASSLAREDHDLVLVFLYMGNDIVRARDRVLAPRTPAEVHALRLPRGLTRRELTDALFYPINDALEVRSHLFILLKTAFETSLMRLGLTAAYFPRTLLRSEGEGPYWTLTAAICQEIAAEAGARDVATVFVLLPAPVQVEEELLQRYLKAFSIEAETVDLDQPNRLMADLLQASGLRVVDALPATRAAYREGAELFGRVDRHLAPAGHDVIADLIEPQVIELLQNARPRPTNGTSR